MISYKIGIDLALRIRVASTTSAVLWVLTTPDIRPCYMILAASIFQEHLDHIPIRRSSHNMDTLIHQSRSARNPNQSDLDSKSDMITEIFVLTP